MKTAVVTALGDPLVSIRQAAVTAGISLRTMWRWRSDDPAFRAALDGARQEQQEVQVALVEESLAARSIQGRATAAETIFFLVNRSPRWRHVNRVEVTGAGGGPVQHQQAMSDEQRLERVAQLLQSAADRKAAGLAPYSSPDEPSGNGPRPQVLQALEN
jgi:hypothetical protein